MGVDDGRGVAPCEGCGLVAPPAQGPSHPYMLSSPGCWSLYGELLGSGAGQLAVDTYAAQHPGRPVRQAVQSVAVHLVSLCAVFERGWPPQRAPRLLSEAVATPPPGGWRWLAPPTPIGALTVFDVLLAEPSTSSDPIRTWAQDVWMAYGEHHHVVRRWLDVVLESE